VIDDSLLFAARMHKGGNDAELIVNEVVRRFVSFEYICTCRMDMYSTESHKLRMRSNARFEGSWRLISAHKGYARARGLGMQHRRRGFYGGS
jgi:hypothetical protein